MKSIALGFLILFLSGCSLKIPEAGSGRAQFKALYLVQGGGELNADDLQSHPEVLATESFEVYKTFAGSRVALWVDKNAVELVDQEWLHEEPQKNYPLVLVGYNDPLYAFRDVLDGFGIEGPVVDWSKENLEPGFSVWMLLEKTESPQSAVFRGYQEVPTVQGILAVTNQLLEDGTLEQSSHGAEFPRRSFFFSSSSVNSCIIKLAGEISTARTGLP